MNKYFCGVGVSLLLSACATTSSPPAPVDAPASRTQQIEAQKAAALPQQKTFKRKLAIGRFSNETRYGRTLLTDSSSDPLGKQATDMLASRLVASNKFLVFERQDLGKIVDEQKRLGASASDLVGVDALVLGSVTEFGRSTTGKAGFLSSTKVQTARAKVEVRLADARTGHVFFTASGTGEASTESGEVAGYGSRAAYDATLNDRAIGAAISDVMTALVNKLDERRWRTDILKSDGRQVFMSGGSRQGIRVGDTFVVMREGEKVKSDGRQVFMSGGSRQGIRVGDTFVVMREGEKVKSSQTGFEITLPGSAVAKVRVVSLFGDAESNEGAVAELVSGTLPAGSAGGHFIMEEGK